MDKLASMNFISAFLKDVLSYINGIIGNYGVSVLVFTLLIRVLLLPLDIKSKKSMKAMERVRPQLDAINKKYAQDKEKQQQKTAELYKKEGISPLSGCLPMLIQLPILFAMFTAMRVVANEQTVQMLLDMKEGIAPAFQPFLWVKNVFQPDAFWSTIIPNNANALAAISAVRGSEILTPENMEIVRGFLASEEYLPWMAQYGADTLACSAPLLMWTLSIPAQFNGLFILPVLSAVTQLLASKMMPATGDAQQQQSNKTMQYFFPLFSLWICASSTSAFAIYWVFSNVIQIIQTWAINLYFNKQENKEKKIEGV